MVMLERREDELTIKRLSLGLPEGPSLKELKISTDFDNETFRRPQVQSCNGA